MSAGHPSTLTHSAVDQARPSRARSFRGQVYLWPLIVALALTLPKLNQGGWSGDTPWYAAIALNAYRAQFEPSVTEAPSLALSSALHPGDRWRAGLWVLPGLGGTPSSSDGGGVCNPERPGGGGQPYFNKPPLAFWLNGIWLWMLGPTILAARLGSVVACALCVLLTTHIARRVTRDDLLACASGVVLALTWEFVRHAHAFSLDLWLVAALLAGVAGLVTSLDGRYRRQWLLAWGLMGVCTGLALLTKPLVGLLALPIVGAWVVFAARVREPGQTSNLSLSPRTLAQSSLGVVFAAFFAAVVAVLVALPWHLSMHLRFPDEFAAQYFGRQIVDRAAGEGADFNRGSGDPLFYTRLLAAAYWPWLPLAALGIIGLLVRLGTIARATPREEPPRAGASAVTAPPEAARALRLLLLGGLWSIAWLIALSLFADKRPRYALIVYPALAWCAAAWLCALAPPGVRRATRRAVPWVACGAALAGVVLAVAPVQMHAPESRQWTELFSFLGSGTIDRVYAGALDGQRAARLYLDRERWPVMPFNARGELVNEPRSGSLILYHRRDGRAPGPGETIVWALDELTLTRLDAEPWSPVNTPDPGE